MNLKDVLTAFIEFREKVITRRTEFELGQARARAIFWLGLRLLLLTLMKLLRSSRKANDPAIAKQELMVRAWPVKDVGPTYRAC